MNTSLGTAGRQLAGEPRLSRVRQLLLVIVPVAVLAAIAVAVATNGERILDGFGHNPPPTDEFVVERTQFKPGRIEMTVVNPQPEPMVPAMIMVDAAIVNDFTIEGGAREIEQYESRTIVVPYDWIEDDPYAITLVSSSGVPTEVEVPAAVPAAGASAGGLGWGALIGMLVGFVPVALGLAWLPALRELSHAALDGFLAFTGGLLVFLAIDAAAEAMAVQATLVPALGGAGLVATGVVVSMVALSLVGRGLRSAARGAIDADGETTAVRMSPGMVLAVLVAVGIGLHNMGEGLAIGSSFSTGEASLAIGLVVGFMIHNLTEGIGIASPLARSGTRLGVVRGIALALLAGVPAVLGIWLGRYVGGPLFATFCFAIAAGAALQVVVEIARSLRSDRSSGFGSTQVQVGFALGLVAMWLTGILAG